MSKVFNMVGGGGVTASIFVTGLSKTDSVTASNGKKTLTGKWAQKMNPEFVGLPSGYTQLEYIASTGTQRIDIQNFTVSPTFGFEIDFEAAYKANNHFLSSFDVSREIWTRIYDINGLRYIQRLNAQVSFAATADRQKLALDGTTNVATKNGVMISEIQSSTYTTNGIMCIFAQAIQGGSFDGYVTGKLYSLVLKNGDTITYNFVPCRRNSDRSIGLYDIVSNAFFGNNGTGKFTAGAEVPQTIYGFLIDKIRDYGTWTVTATDGTKTVTQDVLVDVITEYEIDMSLSA